MVYPSYVPRLADERLSELMAALPAIMLVGPRATGKTTTARRHAAAIVRLDNPVEAAAFRADPDALLRRLPEPVLLDEWQELPQVLGAVKRAVDDDPRPGRFLLTGSVQATLSTPAWPGTGRVVNLPMYGLTVREIEGRSAGQEFVRIISGGDLGALPDPQDPPDLPGYVELALKGGFPDVVVGTAAGDPDAWLRGYLDQVLHRDATGAGPRDPEKLGRYFEALAVSSAGLAQHKTLYDAAGINQETAIAYERLLVSLHLLDLVPAWHTNRLTRLVKSAKRYLVDASLLRSALALDVDAVLSDGDVLGRLLDTFVLSQLRPEAALSDARQRFHHVREKDGRHEVDLLVELAGHRVAAIEVKATAAPTKSDARHLEWLRDRLGDRFLAGALLHTGPRSFALDERLFAVPIACLWAPR